MRTSTRSAVQRTRRADRSQRPLLVGSGRSISRVTFAKIWMGYGRALGACSRQHHTDCRAPDPGIACRSPYGQCWNGGHSLADISAAGRPTWRTTPRRVLLAFLAGTGAGAVVSAAAFTVVVAIHRDEVPPGWWDTILILTFILGMIAWGAGLVLLFGPVWWVLAKHRWDAFAPFTAALLAVCAVAIGVLCAWHLSSMGLAWQHWAASAVEMIVWAGLGGALAVGPLMWRIAYRKA